MTRSLKVLASLMLAASFVVSVPAQASWKERKTYLQCLRTPVAHFDGTIAEAALATPDLSTLVFALQQANLVDVFAGEGNFTVFAPTNAAFAAIPSDQLNALLANNDLLTAVLTYHVAVGHYDPRRAFNPFELETLQGQSVFLNRGPNGAQVNNSDVTCQGVRTKNGLVWIIDSVLLPQF